jgi:molecular chaperone DnaJ
MSQSRDLYDILGVDRNASQAEIKRAFRRLARQHHPDLNPSDPQAEGKFKEASAAYEVLSDPQRRAQYDRYGESGPAGLMVGDLWDQLTGFGDLFEVFFGRPRQRRPSARRGADLRYDLTLTLEQVATGLERTVKVERMVDCDRCDGTGSRSRSSPQTCPACGGAGQVQQNTRTPFGRLSTVTICARCQGEGQAVSDPCSACRGSGRRPGEVETRVAIPAGIEDGAALRIEGAGEPGERGGPPGDLYVVVRVRPHDTFTRRGRDIGCEASIPFTTAALGGTVKVPTLAGEEDLRVPAGTQSGDTLQLRGHGLPDPQTRVRGSLYVTVKVVTPKHLSRKQRKLLEELAEEGEL